MKSLINYESFRRINNSFNWFYRRYPFLFHKAIGRIINIKFIQSLIKQMENLKTKTKLIEKEKLVAETLNGRFAMIGLIAALGAYLTTGQIIPGFV